MGILKQKFLLTAILTVFSCHLFAQATFNAGTHVYKTRVLYTDYVYNCNAADSFRLSLTDSTQTFVAADSSAVLTIYTPLREKAIHKTIDFYNRERQLTRTEKYKGTALESIDDFKYDKLGRIAHHSNNNKLTGHTYTKTYEYEPDKETGGRVVIESSYIDGKIEFYTKDYYDHKNEHYKEIRLNDNKKDVVHVESYHYNKNGQLTGRSVFFPEFGVTKHFTEKVPDDLGKCLKTNSIVKERMTEKNKELFVQHQLCKNEKLLMDKDCNDAELNLINFPGYKIKAARTGNSCTVYVTTQTYFDEQPARTYTPVRSATAGNATNNTSSKDNTTTQVIVLTKAQADSIRKAMARKAEVPPTGNKKNSR